MRMRQGRNSPGALRFAERRRREDEAPRLCAEVPELLSLQLSIEERSDGGAIRHTRRVVIGRAPALFLVPCGDSRCIDGEHDLTSAVMGALHAHEKTFGGDDGCRGSLGQGLCARTIHFDACAEYEVGVSAEYEAQRGGGCGYAREWPAYRWP